MRLLSATVRSYRLHRDVTVEFDRARTLVGGPNESGKSTLIEAVHRGLFLKARGTGDVYKSMSSTLYAEHPEVEVTFETGGRTYTVRKRFSGPSGTTQLVETGGQTWQGDEAEAKLAALLGCAAPSGRVTADKIKAQWTHLWVWQGMSGDDPAGHAATQQSELLQRLQAAGGAVVMQSDLDGRVADFFKRARDATFTIARNPRAGSDLELATKELADATTAHEQAAARLQRLQQAVADFAAAEATVQETARDLERLKQQQEVWRAKDAQAQELRHVMLGQEATLARARDSLSAREGAEAAISDLRRRVAEMRADLQPKQQEVERAEGSVADVTQLAEAADRKQQEAQTAARAARLRRDLASAWVAVHDRRDRLTAVERQLARVRELQGSLEGLRRRQAELPQLDRDGLEELQGIDTRLGQAVVAVAAMSAEVEVVAADQAIRIGDQVVDAGGSLTIAETTDLVVGDAVRLRIHPGGGDSLAEARKTERSLQQQLQGALDRYGLTSIRQAGDLVVEREHLQTQIDSADSSLAERDAAGTLQSHSTAVTELAAAEAEVTRRRENVDDPGVPSDLDAALASRRAQDESVREAEAEERRLQVERDTLREQVRDLTARTGALRNEIAEDEKALTDLEAQLEIRIKDYGDDAARSGAIDTARAAVISAEQALQKTAAALHELQPDLLKADGERLERSLDEANRRRVQAETAVAVNRSILQSGGDDDPKASAAHAAAKVSAARDHHQSVARKAAAIALLDDLFQEQQQALSDRLSQPLADKISDYLQCVFGSDVRAAVTFKDNTFRSIDLVRSSQAGASSFDGLSGGTREQVAAAVRLAIAELLAAEHDGSLPLAFDDSFAYSDPERVQVLQRMLDLAASRGLQVIVLTCNPSDYAGLGARQVFLGAAAS